MWQKKSLSKILVKILILAFSIGFILLGVFLGVRKMRSSQGMWRTFDDVQTARTVAVVNELKAGQFPVRMLSDFGNGGGYLLLNFYSPMVYYLTSLLVFLGTQPLNAVKLIFQLTYLIAGIGMFFCLQSFFPKSRIIPVIGSLLFIGSSYFNYDAYARGALPELAGFSLIPWIFWAYLKLRQYPSSFIFMSLLSLILGLLISTHSITGFIAIPFVYLLLVFEIIARQVSLKSSRMFLIAGGFGLGISAFYFMPMLFEKPFIQYSQMEHVVNGYKSAFISFPEMIGLSRNSDATILPVTLGFWLSFGFTTSLALIFILTKLVKFKISKADNLLWLYLGLSLIGLFLIQNKLSWTVWENSQFLQLTQFPFRYLTITTFLAVIAVSLGLNLIKPNWLAGLIGICLLALTWLSNQVFMTPAGYYFAAEFKAEDPCSTTTWEHEFMPVWVNDCLQKGNSVQLATGSGKLAVTKSTIKNQTDFSLSTNGQAGKLLIAKYYFPGWEVSSQGQPLKINPEGKNGLIGLDVSASDTDLTVSFKDTYIRTLANQISLVSLAILIALSVFDIVKILVKLSQKYSKTSS